MNSVVNCFIGEYKNKTIKNISFPKRIYKEIPYPDNLIPQQPLILLFLIPDFDEAQLADLTGRLKGLDLADSES